jgi:hypothetical protein
MKKKLLALFGLLALSTAAHANTLDYDFRGDWTSLDYNDAAITNPSAPTVQDNSRFYLRVGRLQYKGALNDRFSYVGRLAFNKAATDTGTANAKRDSLNASVEYAFITDKMSDMFSLTLGKFYTEIGGIEGSTSGADLYSISPNYGHVGTKTLLGQNIGVNEGGSKNILYMAGAKGVFTFAETQNIILLATNNVAADPVDANGAFNQNRGLMGVVWRGGFMDKTLTGLLSYHEASPQSATGNKDNKHTFISAGLKYESDWVGSIEYNTTDYKDGASGNKDTLWSGILKVGYKWDQWTPRLEFITSEEKSEIAALGTTKVNIIGAILEYKPTAENVRYHVAVASTTQKPPSGGGDDMTRMDITLGARLYGDFLK